METGAFEPDLALWDAWHPAEVARRLAGVDATWYVTAGWALDLHHGRSDLPRRGGEQCGIGARPQAKSASRAALVEFGECLGKLRGRRRTAERDGCRAGRRCNNRSAVVS